MTEKTVDKWFSKFIRLRDCDEDLKVKCCTCGKYYSLLFNNPLGFNPDVHAGHFISRDSKATRYDEQNADGQCIVCNTFHGGKQFEHALFIDKKYGPGTAEKILIKSKQLCKRTRYDLEVLGTYYRKEAQKLAKEKGIKL